MGVLHTVCKCHILDDRVELLDGNTFGVEVMMYDLRAVGPYIMAVRAQYFSIQFDVTQFISILLYDRCCRSLSLSLSPFLLPFSISRGPPVGGLAVFSERQNRLFIFDLRLPSVSIAFSFLVNVGNQHFNSVHSIAEK